MRKIVKKIFILLMILCVGILPLVGCHGRKGMAPFEMPEYFDESRDYNITFWAKNDTNKAQTEVYNNAIQEFQKLYPNIHITLKLYTNYTDIYNDVITNISTHTTPNVCITYPDHIATYMSGENTVVPVSRIAANPKYGLGGKELKFESPNLEQIIPEFLKECIIGEDLYALPFMRSTEACYINKTYVEKLGYEVPDVLTWDYIWEVSEKAMEKDSDGNFKINGQNVLIPFIYKSTDNMMIQMLKQKDAGYSKESGEVKVFNDDTRDILRTVYNHGKSRAFSTFKISSYPANMLNAGQCIFAIDSTAGSTWMGSEAPLCDISRDKIVHFDTEVRPVPQFNPDKPKMISQGPSICIFNKADQDEVLASWLFAQFLLTDEVQIAYSKTEGYVPVTSKARNNQMYIDYLQRNGENKEQYEIKIEATNMLLNNTNNTFVTPVFNGSASLRDACSQMIENTVKSSRRGETLDDAYIDKLFDDVTALYRLNSLSGVNSEKKDLGPLPAESVMLLLGIALVWVFIIIYIIKTYYVKKT